MRFLTTSSLLVLAGAVALAVTGCSQPDGNEGSQPSPSSISTSDLNPGTLAYLKANAEALASQFGIENPPDVEPVRLIKLQEYATTQIACLKDQGYDATFTEDGEGISYPEIKDSALQKALFLAIYTCELKYPVQPRYMTPLTTDGLKALYDYRTRDLVSCLESKGYSLASDPPSETVFVEDGGMWSPYDGLAIDSEDLKQVYADCPQTRDDIYGT